MALRTPPPGNLGDLAALYTGLAEHEPAPDVGHGEDSALLSSWISGRSSCWRFGLGRAEARCEVRVGDGLAWQCFVTCLPSKLIGGLYQSVMDSSIW